MYCSLNIMYHSEWHKEKMNKFLPQDKDSCRIFEKYWNLQQMKIRLIKQLNAHNACFFAFV